MCLARVFLARRYGCSPKLGPRYPPSLIHRRLPLLRRLRSPMYSGTVSGRRIAGRHQIGVGSGTDHAICTGEFEGPRLRSFFAPSSSTDLHDIYVTFH